MRIIFGTLTPDFKHLRINNEIIDKPFLKGNLVAYLPENGFLPANLSLGKIIDLFIKDKSVRDKIKQDDIIKKHLSEKPMYLSQGELRYFETVLIINHPAGIILLKDQNCIEINETSELKERGYFPESYA